MTKPKELVAKAAAALALRDNGRGPRRRGHTFCCSYSSAVIAPRREMTQSNLRSALPDAF